VEEDLVSTVDLKIYPSIKFEEMKATQKHQSGHISGLKFNIGTAGH